LTTADADVIETVTNPPGILVTTEQMALSHRKSSMSWTYSATPSLA
jgi:hypothetical protein